MKRIVLTGGPGSGKTVTAEHLARANPRKFVLVPEAATQVYAAARTRWDLVDIDTQRDLQRRIYQLQLEQEVWLAMEHGEKILLLDRGTVDGAAYWPDGPQEYWEKMGTTWETELGRYDQVIWMQTAAAIGIYDGQESNPVRFEDANGAVANGDLLARLWAGHGNLHRVEAQLELKDKIAEVAAILERIA